MWISFIIASAIVLFDQITKLITEISFNMGETKPLIGNFLYLTKVYNTGAAWSSFSNNTVFLCVISLVASVIFTMLIINTVKSFKKMKLYTISMGFILGGTVGNLFDRFLTAINLREGVVDMIGVNFASYSFPVFNVADSFLVVGVILLLIDVIFFMDKRKGDVNDK
ncbi:MAG: signal peptidase II [Anaeroplasmataceae bacterium]